jgi:hypothetical protein
LWKMKATVKIFVPVFVAILSAAIIIFFFLAAKTKFDRWEASKEEALRLVTRTQTIRDRAQRSLSAETAKPVDAALGVEGLQKLCAARFLARTNRPANSPTRVRWRVHLSLVCEYARRCRQESRTSGTGTYSISQGSEELEDILLLRWWQLLKRPPNPVRLSTVRSDGVSQRQRASIVQ